MHHSYSSGGHSLAGVDAVTQHVEDESLNDETLSDVPCKGVAILSDISGRNCMAANIGC